MPAIVLDGRQSCDVSVGWKEKEAGKEDAQALQGQNQERTQKEEEEEEENGEDEADKGSPIVRYGKRFKPSLTVKMKLDPMKL